MKLTGERNNGHWEAVRHLLTSTEFHNRCVKLQSLTKDQIRATLVLGTGLDAYGASKSKPAMLADLEMRLEDGHGWRVGRIQKRISEDKCSYRQSEQYLPGHVCTLACLAHSPEMESYRALQ